MLAESPLFSEGLILADVDTERLLQERRRVNTFASRPAYRRIPCSLSAPAGPSAGSAPGETLLRPVSRLPFVPSGAHDLELRCEEVFAIQAAGLAKRLSHTGSRAAVLGLSGGLDSTLALLVTVRAFDLLRLDSRITSYNVCYTKLLRAKEADASFENYWGNFDYTRTASSAYLTRDDRARWFSEYVRQELESMLYGSMNLYTDGYVVHTSLDLEKQTEADKTMKSYLESYNFV